jgi:hypothetical protein
MVPHTESAMCADCNYSITDCSLQSHRPVGAVVLDARRASYSIQPSSLMAQPAFQILVMWLILPSWNSIT